MDAILNFCQENYGIKVRYLDNLLMKKKIEIKDGLLILEVNQILVAILN
jgi:hypothetical protein